MHTAGVVLLAGGAALGLVTCFGLMRVVPAWAVLGLAGTAAVGAVSGALLVQHDTGGADWVVALPVAAFLVPFHTWLVFRPVGRRSGG